MTNAEVYAKVTDQIVTALESGTAPWAKPWTGGSGLPCNGLTRRHYNGVNALSTQIVAMASGFGSRGWVTFRQALELGAVVRKGEKGTAVMYMSKVPDRKASAETGTARDYFLAKLYTVFNLDQLTDLDGSDGAVAAARGRVDYRPNVIEAVAECDAMVARTNAAIQHGGGRAAYIPAQDRIVMPDRASFRDLTGYYATLFHELGHWTGHETRLKRDLTGRFGAGAYAAEELTAELTAAFLSQRFGFDVISQSAAYLQSWLRAIADNRSVLVTAASSASKAAEYLFPAETATEKAPAA